jgi:hypothetical protein
MTSQKKQNISRHSGSEKTPQGGGVPQQSVQETKHREYVVHCREIQRRWKQNVERL